MTQRHVRPLFEAFNKPFELKEILKNTSSDKDGYQLQIRPTELSSSEIARLAYSANQKRTYRPLNNQQPIVSI